MRAETFWVDGEDERVEPWPSLLRALALVNDAVPAADGTLTGDPTEVALLEAAIVRGVDRAALESQSPRHGEFPFDSDASAWLPCTPTAAPSSSASRARRRRCWRAAPGS
jgi:Ca2+-transporting ATPase